MADHAAHPAVAHQKAAADHFRRAAEVLDRANRHHEQGEHQSAAELSKGATAHAQEASTHLARAQHLHAEAEHERAHGSHGTGEDKGSHFNANDPGADEGEHYGSNADDGEPYAR